MSISYLHPDVLIYCSLPDVFIPFLTSFANVVYTCLSIYLLLYLPVNLFTYLSIYLLISVLPYQFYLLMSLPAYLSPYLLISLLTCLSIYTTLWKICNIHPSFLSYLPYSTSARNYHCEHDYCLLSMLSSLISINIISYLLLSCSVSLVSGLAFLCVPYLILF